MKLTFCWWKRLWKEKGLGLRNKGSTILALHQIPTKHFRACEHMAVAHLSCLIVNTAAGSYSYGQTLALNTVTLSLTCMFQQRKRECFEHERCSTMVKSLTTVYMICCLCLHVFVFRTWCMMGSCCLCLHSVFSVFTYMGFPHIYILSLFTLCYLCICSVVGC